MENSSGAPRALMFVPPMEMLPEMGDSAFQDLGKSLNCWEASPRAMQVNPAVHPRDEPRNGPGGAVGLHLRVHPEMHPWLFS